jgi:stress-induced morphogen
MPEIQEQMIVKETLKENLMSEIHSLTLLNASGVSREILMQK